MPEYLRRISNWLYHATPGEPLGLNKLFRVGILVIIAGASLIMFVVFRQELWQFDDTTRCEQVFHCSEQCSKRLSKKNGLEADLTFSQRRLDLLKAALVDDNKTGFVNAPAAIALESKSHAQIKRNLDAAKVESTAKFLPKITIGLLLVVFFSLLAARLASKHGLLGVGGWSRSGEINNWRLRYFLWVAVIFLVHAAREIYTSVYLTEKSWFAFSSFCISKEVWLLMLIPALGFAMVAAYPATILWNFSRAANRPRTLDMGHTDGQWGVGGYVLFLQTWSILSFAFLLLPGALWLRVFLNDPRFDADYLITGAVVFASVLLIAIRLLANAVAIRKAYRASLQGLGKTWQEIQEKKPPPDPTINFLGEHWWKLPAVILGIVALLWLVVQQVGVADFLVRILGAN